MLRKITVLTCAIVLAALAASAANFTTRGATTSSDDSCDIAVTPAATLLLPYFEVDINPPASSAHTTLFSIVNTSPQPQIARVTLWSDWAFPAYSFDLFLTGYDVLSVNLRDILVSGAIPQTSAGAIPGPLSQSNYGNPNHLQSMVSDCSNRPQSIPPDIANDLRRIFTIGRATGSGTSCTNSVGGTHTNAIGYATIDVVATCSPSNPSTPSYFTKELLFDNVLTGDYQQVNPSSTYGNYAGGNPLVHIRAVPEGGPAGSSVATNLPFTFYDRLTVATATTGRTIDRRQPLPSAFAAHYRLGGVGDFATRLFIWREAASGTSATCASYMLNSDDFYENMLLFDEHENSFEAYRGPHVLPPPGRPGLPPTSSLRTSASLFPQNSGTGDNAGWYYINMSNRGSRAYSVASDRNFPAQASGVRANQNWIVIEMTAEGRFNVIYDAAPLANGCSIAPAANAQVGPGANVTP